MNRTAQHLAQHTPPNVALICPQCKRPIHVRHQRWRPTSQGTLLPDLHAVQTALMLHLQHGCRG